MLLSFELDPDADPEEAKLATEAVAALGKDSPCETRGVFSGVVMKVEWRGVAAARRLLVTVRGRIDVKS